MFCALIVACRPSPGGESAVGGPSAAIQSGRNDLHPETLCPKGGRREDHSMRQDGVVPFSSHRNEAQVAQGSCKRGTWYTKRASACRSHLFSHSSAERQLPSRRSITPRTKTRPRGSRRTTPSTRTGSRGVRFPGSRAIGTAARRRQFREICRQRSWPGRIWAQRLPQLLWDGCCCCFHPRRSSSRR